ncbi:MAG: GHKL domain-containing protein [Proteobacteria bacterium]|nr:GHKL domain-containing protein [Pseudomonadota bacterium]MBU1709361.1 GHKL domain-containing protein [Pseudomonadota bacterium]
MPEDTVERIKKPLLIPLGIVFLLLICGAVFGAYKLQHQSIIHDVRERIDRLDLLFQGILDEEAALLNSMLDNLETEPSLQEAFVAGDRDMLLQRALPYYQQINSRYHITHFYFHTTDKVNFLRMHNPPRHSDLINRFTLEQAVSKGKTAYGIELGPFGTFTLRVVRPWYIKGALAGYLELGKEIEHITPKLKEILGIDLFFFIDKPFLNREKWQEGLPMMGRIGDWDSYSTAVLMDKTMDDVPDAIAGFLEAGQDAHKGQLFEIESQNRNYFGGFTALKDAGNRHVGDIFAIRDVSREHTSLIKFSLIILFSGMFLGIVLILVFYKYIDRLEASLVAAREALENQHLNLRQLFSKVEQAKKEWERTMDCMGEMVILADGNGVVRRINKAFKDFVEKSYDEILGKDWQQLVGDFGIARQSLSGDLVAEVRDPRTGRWFVIKTYPFTDSLASTDNTGGTVVTISEITQLKKVSSALELRNTEINENRQKLQTALDKLSGIIQKVAAGKDFGFRFENPNLSSCSEIKNCNKEDCPCYGGDAPRCWQIAGTFCRGEVQGEFASKLDNCINCQVYKKATEDPIYQIGEEFNNMMHILEAKNSELHDAFEQLKSAQAQMLQTEKMASVGQLAAGVAHEINNPMGFISSNLTSLGKYTGKVTEFIETQAQIIEKLRDLEAIEESKTARKKLKIDFILEDLKDLVAESLEGADRVKTIVQGLKTFSRVDQAVESEADINECLESTINVVWNELKYKATVEKNYGDIPRVKCFPQQLNQVFMNLLVNAAQAIEDQGVITIRSWGEKHSVRIAISDTGAGIAEKHLSRLFEPFFTTKDVGKGTGLGLSICYDIIKKHGGEITVDSEVGRGSTFTVILPIG